MPTAEAVHAVRKVTSLPARLEPAGLIGWGVREFADARAAADWFLANQDAAMPCWRRMDVVAGELTVVR